MHTHIKNSNLEKRWTRILGLFIGLALLLCRPLWATPNLDLQEIPSKHSLHELVLQLHQQGVTEKQKVVAVNTFFNHMPRALDKKVWGRKDYWATPDELLRQRRGDCEDVAIAKYFTLRKLGIADSHLRLAYGKIADLQRGTIEPHMVLIYIPNNGSPLVLGSLNEHLLKVSERQDLILEYTFNIKSLWRWRAGSSVLLGKAEVLAPWRKLLKRL